MAWWAGMQPKRALAPADDVRFEDAPISRFEAFSSNADAAFNVYRAGAREDAARADLWRRQLDIEKRLGRTVPRSRFMTGGDRLIGGGQRWNPVLGEWEDLTDPGGERQMDERAAGVSLTDLAQGGLDDDAYEASIEKLRREQPGQMAGVPTRAELDKARDERLRGLASRAGAAAAEHPLSGFGGSMVGTMADPVNLLVTAYTGGLGASRGLLARATIQGGVNAGVELAQQPFKAADAAAFGGPEWTPGQAALDVAAGGAGGAAFEIAGAALRGTAGALWRRLGPRAARSPGLTRALEVLDQTELDEAALAGADGEAFESGLASLERFTPPPRERDLDLSELLPATSGARAEGPAAIGASAEYRGRPIHAASFDPLGLKTDAARFQYKADADGEGVTARLRGVEAWDATASGKVIVWQDKAGELFVADGHQRRGLAARMVDKGWDARLDGYLFREADGWTARQVRVVAALKNIREGSGTILDAAKVFRDAAEALEDRSLPVTGDFIAQARALARLSPDAFRAVVNGVVPQRYAAEIGQMAAGRPDLHDAMVRLLKDGAPANGDEARALVFEALQDDWIRTQGVQDDLFGHDPAISAMIGRAKVAAAVKSGIGKDAKLFSQLVRHADAIEAGGNALARDENQARLALDRAAMEVTGRLALRHGPIGEAMAEAAAKVTRGEMTPAHAARPIIQRLRRAIKDGEDLAATRGAAIDPEGPGPTARAVADGFDDPAGEGARGQLAEAAEDADLEADAPPGLFDDIARDEGFERGRAALTACAAEG